MLIPLFLLLPVVASAYQVYVRDTILIACIGALGLNLLIGYAGQISTGHGAFIGVGAFASALLSTRLGAPFWLSVPVAGAITALVGFGVGLPSVRIRGLYLAVSTLAAQVLISWLLSRPFLAGSGSITAPRPEFLQDDRAYYSRCSESLFSRRCSFTTSGVRDLVAPCWRCVTASWLRALLASMPRV